MRASTRIVDGLNELLTVELTAINQYFLHSKMCANWGYERLASHMRTIAFAEMRDAEELCDRILLFEGLPNLQRMNAVVIGETVPEQLRAALATEHTAIETIHRLLPMCDEDGDQGTREFLQASLPDEEEHLDWIETQLGLIDSIGEQLYLASQVRE